MSRISAFASSLLLLFCLAGSPQPASAQDCTAPPDGLVSWWRGENDAKDAFGINHGTLQNGATFAAGKVGQAFNLDGVDDFVNISDDSSLDFGPTSPMTIDLWAYRTGSASAMHLIGKRGGSINYQLVLDKKYNQGLVFNSNNGGAYSTVDLPLNTWTHIAATFDGTTFRLYVNGAEVATGTGALGAMNDALLQIGSSGNYEVFGGLLDEVSLYARALSATEIQAIYNAGAAGKCVPDNAPPSTPILISPAHGASVDAPFLLEMTAIDADSSGLRFKVELLQNGTVVKTYDQSTAPDDWSRPSAASGQRVQLDPSDLAAGTYKWRAYAFDALNQSAVSETRTFTYSGVTKLNLCEATRVPFRVGQTRSFTFSLPATSQFWVTLQRKERSWNCTATLLLNGTIIASASGVPDIKGPTDILLAPQNLQADDYVLEIASEEAGEVVLRACTNFPDLKIGQPFIGKIYRNLGYDWAQTDVPVGATSLDLSVEVVGNGAFLDVWRGSMDNTEHWQTGSYWDPNVNLSIPNPPAGRYYLRVYERGYVQSNTQEHEYSIFSSAPGAAPPQIVGISPNHAGNTGSVTVTIGGGNFSPGATVKLTKTGQTDIVATSVSVADDKASLGATFDLTGKTAGVYTVVVTNADGKKFELANAFTIESGGTSQLQIQFVGREKIRLGRPSTYTMIVGNIGSIDATDAVVWLAIPAGWQYVLPSTLALRSIDTSRSEQVVITFSIDLIPAGQSSIHIFQLTPPTTVATFNRSLFVGPKLRTAASCEDGIGGSLNTEQNVRDYLTHWSAGQVTFNAQSPQTQASGLTQTTIGGILYWQNAFEHPLVITGGSEPHPASGEFSHENGYKIDFGAGANSAVFPKLDKFVMENPEKFTELPSRTDGTRLFKGTDGSIWARETPENNYPLQWDVKFPPPPTTTPQNRQISAGDSCGGGNGTNGPNGPGTGSGGLGIGGVGAFDPNDKTGPAGSGDERFIRSNTPLGYLIQFENKASATAPAAEVVITDQLNANKVDFDTFALGPIRFGADKVLTPPANSQDYIGFEDLRPAKNTMVRVTAGLDKVTGIATWRYESFDATTGEIQEDPDLGFLPPNVTAPEGQGSVFFTVMPKAGLANGTEIKNKATIVFDANAPIVTPEWLNTIETTAPKSHVLPLPEWAASKSFPVTWKGSDTPSGVESFTIYVAEDDGAYAVWQQDVTTTSATYAGTPGHKYKFYSVVKDNAGNVEAAPSVPDAVTKVGIFDITGKVKKWENKLPVGLPDVTVTLKKNGLVKATTTTDTDGRFTFSQQAPGTYVVKPSKTGIVFNPKNRTLVLRDVTPVAAGFSTYKISGKVTNAQGTALSNLEMRLKNNATPDVAALTTKTAADGSYSFFGVGAGNYTVKPTPLSGFTFAPTSTTITLTKSSGNQAPNAGANFVRSAIASRPGFSLLMSRGTVQADLVTLRFVVPLDEGMASELSHYGVTVNGSSARVVWVKVSSNVVTLRLEEGVLPGDQISARWDGLVDAKGNLFSGSKTFAAK